MRWDQLAERQIQKARAEGQLDDLKGAGKPLPSSGGDAATNAGFRIMAEAGAVPEEIGLRKKIEMLRTELAETTRPDDRRAITTKLADLEMRLAIEEEIRRRVFR